MLRPIVAVQNPLERGPGPGIQAGARPGASLPASPERGAAAGAPPGEANGASNGALAGAPPAGAGAPASEPPGASEPADEMVPVIPESREGSLLWRVRGMVRTVRPHQWVKNLFVLAPVVFARELTSLGFIKSALGAFAVFCLLAGAVYTMNDLVDVEADRAHPVKRHRPIASGRVPVPVAKAMVAVLVLGSLGSALVAGIVHDRMPFFFVTLLYFVQNIAYSFRLKKVAYVDVGFIALGFVLRVLAGGYATKTPISWYMIACTALLALFLGFGKRRHELAGANAGKQRAALEAYSQRALTIALAITGTASVAVYLAYTRNPPPFFQQKEWLWLTTVHPVFGVIRFIELVVHRPKAESPTQELLRDVPSVLNVILWVVEIIAIVYAVRVQ